MRRGRRQGAQQSGGICRAQETLVQGHVQLATPPVHLAVEHALLAPHGRHDRHLPELAKKQQPFPQSSNRGIRGGDGLCGQAPRGLPLRPRPQQRGRAGDVAAGKDERSGGLLSLEAHLDELLPFGLVSGGVRRVGRWRVGRRPRRLPRPRRRRRRLGRAALRLEPSRLLESRQSLAGPRV